MITITATQAADRLFLFFGPLEFSAYVDSLEQFAENGTIAQDLKIYLNRVDETEREAFREALTAPSNVDPLTLSRVLNTPIGEMILERLGRAVTLPSGGNGKYALRAAINEASFSDEGLTLLGLLKAFPTDIRIDPNIIFVAAKELEQVIDKTDAMVEQVAQISSSAASYEVPVDFDTQLDLRQSGPFEVVEQTWILEDTNRDFPVGSGLARQFRVLVFYPQQWRNEKTPIVVMSHGLASNPEDRARLAKHLASYGFMVAAPQHVGSDAKYVEDLRAGLNNDIFDVNEFINRPLDVSYVLDELERRNSMEFGNRLNVDNVGLLGHSFGGYTVLALAGATIEQEHLQAECDRRGYLNVSLLLQCRALELPEIPDSFRDERVKAVASINPVNNSIFGPEGLGQLDIPIAVVAGSLDPATPAIFEQFLSFPWIPSPSKYLVLVEGQAHVDFSQVDAGITDTLNSIEGLTLPTSELIHNYGDALTLAFFETHIAAQPKYQLYLQSSYTQHISQEPFSLHLLKAEQENELVKALQNVGIID